MAITHERHSRIRIQMLATLVPLLSLSCGTPTDRLMQLAEASLAQVQGNIELAGLGDSVEVLRDRWGIAHIYAQSTEDLFFAQGFVAAQDRLWQLEMWRRTGEGRLSEIAGPQAFERDRLARLLRYRGDMDAEWTAYHPQGRTIITAFVNGVNAFIEHCADNPPVEFKLTGVEPEPWTPEVPLLRMAGLPMTRNALAELRLARTVNELGVEEANRRDQPDPWQELRVPRGLDVSEIPAEVIDVLETGYAPLPRIPVLEQFRTESAPPDTDQPPAGSNNWVVSGSMTTTGQPMLANDPHRRISLPSLRYLVHLRAPGWNVIGSGEPALPGVAIGHNERIAWGLTIVGIDQQDIFVEQVNPTNRNEVRWRGAWEPLRVEIDTIWIKDEGPREVELKFSRHGPIIFEDTLHHRAYAFRSVLSEPGTAGYLASLRLDQAQNWEEFLAAMDHWLVPSENMIYADVDGNIGWQAAGMTPIRSGTWVGRLPVPGSGRYDWRGFRPMRQLPREHNPARGYITTANHNIMPPGYSPPLGYSWASPERYHRLDDVLSDSSGFSIEDFERLQQDVYSNGAAQVKAVLEGMSFEDARLDRARALLVDWDARLNRDSPSAALYEAWRATSHNTLSDMIGTPSRRDSLLRISLAAAIDSLERSQGKDWSAWRWGKMHQTLFTHSVSSAFDLPAVERPGDRTTVNVTGQHGASFREIIDLADWDNSVGTSVPGQSGQPASPHYGDLLELWANGQYFPLAYTREAVETNMEHRLVLKPQRP